MKILQPYILKCLINSITSATDEKITFKYKDYYYLRTPSRLINDTLVS